MSSDSEWIDIETHQMRSCVCVCVSRIYCECRINTFRIDCFNAYTNYRAIPLDRDYLSHSTRILLEIKSQFTFHIRPT